MENCRLIYRSLSTEEEVSNESLRKLIAKARCYNEQKNITGLLLLTGNQFLQVLEGPSKAVNCLFQKISRDPMHHTVKLIEYREPAQRYFEDWHMRLVDLYDLTSDERNLFIGKYDTDESNILIPDRAPLVFSLLLDAKAICRGQPWKEDKDPS